MTTFDLAVNGDSYMEVYASGGGHIDLGQQLGIEKCHSMAIGGSANSRLIRTTLKHSYQTNRPTLYVLGIGFISRWEVAILDADPDSFEGRWTNPQNQDYRDRWQREWGPKETEQLVRLKLNADMYSILDRLEDLMYNLLSLVQSLHVRGHRIIMYNQADKIYQEHLEHARVAMFKNNPVFIDGLKWRAVPWQLDNGVPPTQYAMTIYHVPDDLKHPQSGHHGLLNSFLVDYIKTHGIMQ